VIIGVISDTHNNTPNIQAAVEIFRQKGVDTIIHCGDLSDPDQIWYFEGFHLIYVFGNSDFSTSAITANLQVLNYDNIARSVYQGEVDGVPIAAVHGHISGYIYEFALKGTFKYVFHGHTHVKRQEQLGPTTIINPGPCGGKNSQFSSVCVIDLTTNQVEFIRLN